MIGNGSTQGVLSAAILSSQTLTPNQLSSIQKAYQAVFNGLISDDTPFTDDPKDTGYGYSDGVGVYTGQKYHKANAKNQYATIIHELSHHYAQTDDNGYYFLPAADAPRTDLSPVTYTDTLMVSTDELINNADSYAGFLTQYFYKWV